MIHIDLTLNGVTVKKQVKTDWNELTFEDYLNLFTLSGDLTDLLAYFIGIDKATLSKARISGLETILIALEFIQTPPTWERKPDMFMGEVMPKDITFQALAPYIDCRHILQQTAGKDLKEFVQEYPKYCAIYIQAIRSGWEGYDYDKALELVPEVMEQPAWEVVGLASFFIAKLTSTKNNTEKNSPQGATHRKKSKRGLKS
jgi:hypothetical protein